MADPAADIAGKLAAIRKAKAYAADPSPFNHAELNKIAREYPWVLDWVAYVPLKKREAKIRETLTADASKANVVAQNTAIAELNTLEGFEKKHELFKTIYPIPGGRRRRTGRVRRVRGRRRNTRRH